MTHPVYGMIYPPLIVYLAEAGKVLPELERFIIDEVTDGIVQTRAQYDSDFKISVNITAHSLLWDIEGYIRQTMEQKEIDAHMLWIEITEQDILLQTDVVVRKLEELKKQGHKLLIDDFGMGHTSLIYLQSKLATTSSTGGLSLALQRAFVTARPKGRYRKHFHWSATKRYFLSLLFLILLLALLYIFVLLRR